MIGSLISCEDKRGACVAFCLMRFDGIVKL
jgi:hypothetical protein